jgi:2-polyprenyl-3-methyl-5-hydroxy-6-metoxy-1,4-benzoquinol methylase
MRKKKVIWRGLKPRPREEANRQLSALTSEKASPTAWAENALWYDSLVGDAGSDYHRKVVLPGVMGLLRRDKPAAGELGLLDDMKVLDLCCGQGVLCRLMVKQGAKVTGVDASGPLIEIAKKRGPREAKYLVADAGQVFSDAVLRSKSGGILKPGRYSVVTCVLALQDLTNLDAAMDTVTAALHPGGRFVAVVMHPCFRAPKHTHWGWDERQGVQYRRVDRYLRPYDAPIATHPGSDPDAHTMTHHRPLHEYINAMAQRRLYVEQLEEWPSHKKSDSGPRAPAENVARQEIPMFLAWRARYLPGRKSR